MPKKPSKTTQAQGRQPEPAQSKAVERLIGAGDFAQASVRARALVQRFPDHGGTNRLLVDALYQARNQAAATLAAYQWAERRPTSQMAQESLFQLALESEYALLASRAAGRLTDLGIAANRFQPDAAALDEMLQQPDGTRATLEDMERFEIGKLHMEAQDFGSAVRILEGVAVTPARNNRALALFHLGRSEDALTAALEAWQQDAGNLFALGLALQLRLYRGDETGARGLAVPLAQAEARRIEDAQAQLAALLLIWEDQAAWDAFERSSKAPWIGEATGIPEAMRLLYGAGAASRLGHGDQARALWKRALARHPGLAAARENLDALKRDGVPPPYPALFDLGQVFPIGIMSALHARDAAVLLSRIDRLDINDSYLEAIYLSGDERVRGFAAHFLQHRLGHTAPATAGPTTRRAATILRDLARLPIGTTQERLGFLNVLRQRKLLAADQAVKFWDGTALQEIQLVSTEITREPVPSDLPKNLRTLHDQSLLHLRAGRLDAAEAAINTILARVPDHQTVLGNLAALRGRQGRGEECRELLRRVIAIHPDYLFGRCNLAGLLIEDGELDAAAALLEGLAQRPQLHIQELFTLHGVMAMLYRARGEDQAAATLIATLEGLVQDEDDERLLTLAKARVARATTGGRLKAALGAFIKRKTGLV
ncbi:tetratricopeptide repeat protein [uncultured Thiodictyon sp.]|uniref:tetratricopeptide repeat protein n=1 Tax=uncultured Thiodictyon sp. TaxID=1846217 RepID=UPI0025FB47AB|nr:tetratricopeptide repeat protein [uncultured Thiodictyon sp.]